ncbi:RDD family protein [Luteolibacter pohnpeiensis]|uniref:RDD family protein n=1 Tax=Luteolibacter pohnpeiensis TaxID=454153 RepID=A0A934S560_9BACT|nr:RDD family protein [Luteolibacter pohnpeiensis]MBK1882761.1 RDD family protein [Luteolibacter pohnpeiensis]
MDSDSEPTNDQPKPSLPKPSMPPPSLPKVPAPSLPPVSINHPSPGEAPPPPPPPKGDPSMAPSPAKAEPEEEIVPRIGEATLGSRVVGGVIDMVIAILIFAVFGRFSGALGFLLSVGYVLVKDSLPFLDGQSIGKKAVKTKAVTEEGESLSGNWKAGAIRNASLCVWFFSWVELIVLLINKNEAIGLRRLGDQWAKTKVITWPPVEQPEVVVSEPEA